MLVLHRRANESIVITHPNLPSEIEITALEFSTDPSGINKITLGFKADKSIEIDRKEVAISKRLPLAKHLSAREIREGKSSE